MLVVTSAGNAGGGAWNKLTMPADADSILTVDPLTNSESSAVLVHADIRPMAVLNPMYVQGEKVPMCIDLMVPLLQLMEPVLVHQLLQELLPVYGNHRPVLRRKTLLKPWR